MSLYGMSKETDIIEEFWSHSWHAEPWKKVLCLLSHFDLLQMGGFKAANVIRTQLGILRIADPSIRVGRGLKPLKPPSRPFCCPNLGFCFKTPLGPNYGVWPPWASVMGLWNPHLWFWTFWTLGEWVHPKRQLIHHRFETLTFAGRWCLLSWKSSDLCGYVVDEIGLIVAAGVWRLYYRCLWWWVLLSLSFCRFYLSYNYVFFLFRMSYSMLDYGCEFCCSGLMYLDLLNCLRMDILGPCGLLLGFWRTGWPQL